jgi:hypothetical protein
MGVLRKVLRWSTSDRVVRRKSLAFATDAASYGMVVRPDLLHQDRAASESGADQHHQNLPEGVYTGIWRYAAFPITMPVTTQSQAASWVNIK